jgi:hypothetical protein
VEKVTLRECGFSSDSFFALNKKRCQIVSRPGKKVKTVHGRRWQMSGNKGSQKNWVDRLSRAMQNLPGAKKKSQTGEKPDPEEYAWKETEEEYQKAQAEWLEKVRPPKKEKKE